MNETESRRSKYRQQLDEWEVEIRRLRSLAATTAASVRADLTREVEELERKAREARVRLESLREAGEAAWESARKDLESSWASLKAGVKAAAEKLREKT